MIPAPLPYLRFSFAQFLREACRSVEQRTYLEVVAWGIDYGKVVPLVACMSQIRVGRTVDTA